MLYEKGLIIEKDDNIACQSRRLEFSLLISDGCKDYYF